MEWQKYELFTSGNMQNAYQYFGAHEIEIDDQKGYIFRVYAPNAKEVKVLGDFNNWYIPINMVWTDGGVWEVFIAGAEKWMQYKYQIETYDGKTLYKADPYAKYSKPYPSFNSVLFESGYTWNDSEWLKERSQSHFETEPMLIYEVHLGSWKKTLDNQFLTYPDLAHQLVAYVLEMGYTHIELMPISEHPFLGSWGYQQTGFFSVTERYGNPDDLKYFVDVAHQHGIGVILDFVPAHFCKDDHGLYFFDGGNVYDYADSGRRENELWGTANFDFGKGEVISFLLSSLDYWMTEFHVDGIRYDAVSNLIHRNGLSHYGMNDEGIQAIKHINGILKTWHHDVLLIAEDSSSYPNVTKAPSDGGLGFDLKWDLGFANDHFKFMKTPFIDRKHESDKITFARAYHENERYVLPYSHDEVVHGKGTMLTKQQGTREQEYAGLQTEFAFWLCHPGKKLLFMGQDFAQEKEWNEAVSLDWHLIESDIGHKTFFENTKRLFHLYRNNSAFYERDFDLNRGFAWNEIHTDFSIYALTRFSSQQEILCIFNFDDTFHGWYPIKASSIGKYKNLLTGETVETDEHGLFHIPLSPISFALYEYIGG